MSAPTDVSGAATGYRPGHTLPIRVELIRQLRRRRVQITLAFMAILPFILLGAFKIGNGSSNRNSGQLVDLATSSAINFVVFALFAAAGFLLIVVVALFFGDTVASEASWSSLKYLLAIPVPRGRLLRQKAIVAGLMSLAGLVLLPAVGLVVGLIWYGDGDMVSPTGEALPFGMALGRLGLGVVYLAINLVWVAGLALLLSVSTNAPLAAVGGAVLVSIVSEILDSITALGGLREYLPTHYAYAWADLFSTDIDWGDMARGVLSASLYGVIFTALAARRFATRDITS
ncbi:MAG TPA: ABC transporter permease subunit [Pseudonocardiaceae bacterium]|jgi:ABC-2 type transport system permease protein|nr:ABC transporter permease subunit [Pseudonocardiaceae bacterium]